jgi:DNA excision repair protein ERCC-2
MKASNSQRLVQEYQALVAGLTDQGILQRGGADTVLASPVLPEDIMQVRDKQFMIIWSPTSHFG